ncbi:hypothetical protein Hte_001779 [Hypoxylon texense]
MSIPTQLTQYVDENDLRSLLDAKCGGEEYTIETDATSGKFKVIAPVAITEDEQVRLAEKRAVREKRSEEQDPSRWDRSTS